MKKLSKEAKKRLIILALNRHKHNLARKGKEMSDGLASVNKVCFPNCHEIIFPEIFTIYSPDDFPTEFEKTIFANDEVRNNFGRKSCVLDFSNTRQIKAASLLMLYATMDIARENGALKSRIIWSKVAPAVNKALKRSNLDKLVNNVEVKPAIKGVRQLPIIAGVGNENMEEVIDHIKNRIYQNEMEPDTEHVFGDAISETINNVGRHAYPESKYGDDKKWWLTCSLIGDQLYLAIYDKGVGIPETIVKRDWFKPNLKIFYRKEFDQLNHALRAEGKNTMHNTFANITDAICINLSMQGDATSTGENKHGQGSKSIKALVQETKNGKLWVFSNKGLYTLINGEESPKLYNLARKISGTLVQWNIKI